MHSNRSTPQVSIRPNCISLYNLATNTGIRTEAQKLNEINLKVNDNKGVISLKANKKVRDAINWLIYFSDVKQYWNKKQAKMIKFRLSFTTLTLSSKQDLSDNDIKSKFLNQILTVLRNEYNVKHYVWRAEAQVNGNIHFHITCDKFIPWHELRNKWNNIQNKAGYIDAFKEKHKHKNPNSVDVHEISNIKNIASYLAEYCTKQTKGALYTPIQWKKNRAEICTNPKDMLIENTPYFDKKPNGTKVKRNSVRVIFGKQWGLSQSLSQVKSVTYERDAWLDAEIRKIKSAFAGKVVVNDYVTCIYVSVKDWSKIVKGYLYKLFIGYLRFHKYKVAIPLHKFDVEIIAAPSPKVPEIIEVVKSTWSNNWEQQSLAFN